MTAVIVGALLYLIIGSVVCVVIEQADPRGFVRSADYAVAVGAWPVVLFVLTFEWVKKRARRNGRR